MRRKIGCSYYCFCARHNIEAIDAIITMACALKLIECISLIHFKLKQYTWSFRFICIFE